MQKNVFTFVLIAACVGLTIALAAGKHAPPETIATEPALAKGVAANPYPQQEADDEVLQRRISLPATSPDRIKLVDALRTVAAAGNFNMRVNWRELERQGVDVNTPIWLISRLNDVSVRSALRAVLDGASGVPYSIGWGMRDHILVVSTWDDLGKQPIGMVYNIRDIMNAFAEYYGDDFDEQQCVAEIISLLTTTVAPDTWRDNGGSVGTTHVLMGLLIVIQTPERQREVSHLLASFRQASRSKGPAEFSINAIPPG